MNLFLKKKKKILHYSPVREFGWPYLGKATAASRPALPIANSACGIFLCPNDGRLPMLGIFNVRTDVKASDCTQGLYGQPKRVCIDSGSGRKVPLRTGESNLRQQRAGPTLYQLSYTPVPYVYRYRCIPLRLSISRRKGAIPYLR